MSEKKKVLFFIYQMGAGGAARTLLNILNHLDRQRFEPILVTLNFDGSYEKFLKEDIKFIKLTTNRLRKSIIPLAKVIRREKPDLIFSTIPVYNTVATLARFLSFTKTKGIVREAAYLGGDFKTNLKLRLFGLLYQTAHQVVSLSEGVKQNLINRYRINEQKITVIYNPIDLQNIEKQITTGKLPAEHEVIFQKNTKIIVTAGRLVAEKDQQTLLKAFAKVRQKLDVELFILGEGELEQSLKQQAKALGILKYVHFAGFVSNPYIYFHRADLFALSSLNEGFGHVLVEALATKVPIISTACKPGALEVLDNGQYGTLVPLKNADKMSEKMYDLLTLTDEEKEEIINKGYQRAQMFAVEKIVHQYEQLFFQTIGDK